MGRKLRVLLAVAGAGVFALGAMQVPAHAAPAQGTAAVQLAAEGQASVQLEVQPAEQQAAAAACNGEPVEVYGYVGCIKAGSWIRGCPWEEKVVVAPNSTIWHVWPNSGGWKEMPNNGRADDAWNCYWNGNGQRQIEVLVGNDIWYSYYSGGWRGWYLHP